MNLYIIFPTKLNKYHKIIVYPLFGISTIGGIITFYIQYDLLKYNNSQDAQIKRIEKLENTIYKNNNYLSKPNNE